MFEIPDITSTLQKWLIIGVIVGQFVYIRYLIVSYKKAMMNMEQFFIKYIKEQAEIKSVSIELAKKAIDILSREKSN